MHLIYFFAYMSIWNGIKNGKCISVIKLMCFKMHAVYLVYVSTNLYGQIVRFVRGFLLWSNYLILGKNVNKNILLKTFFIVNFVG